VFIKGATRSRISKVYLSRLAAGVLSLANVVRADNAAAEQAGAALPAHGGAGALVASVQVALAVLTVLELLELENVLSVFLLFVRGRRRTIRF
jgi:hypothetical protein